MSSAVKSWRMAFLTLRDETLASPPSSSILRLLDSLIFSQVDSLVSASSELPPHEVTSDMMLLVELARSISRSDGTQDVTSAFVKLSHLLHLVTHYALLEMNSTSWALVLDSLLSVVEHLLLEGTTRSVLIENVDIITATKHYLESLRRLFCLNFTTASVCESEKLLHFLLQVVGYLQRSSILSFYIAEDHKLPRFNIVWETLTIPFIMVGEVYSRVSSSLSVGISESAFEVLSKVMDIFTAKIVLVEYKIGAMFYVELLHCMHLILADTRQYVGGHVAGFVAALRIFFRYGLENKSYDMKQPCANKDFGSLEKNLRPMRSKLVNVAYRPPHLRRKAVESLHCGEDAMASPEDESCKTYCASSDSDYSDEDGLMKDSCSSLFAKARLNAIICIQDLCRADPKSFTTQWALLLPSSDVLQHRKSETTLISCFLFDPNLKVRIAAGFTIMAMLDGPTSVSLQVAEYKESSKCGSFTSLSSSLGYILMELHSGILYLVKHENRSRLLELSFKILLLLLSSTPYSRMSEELLWQIISSVQSRIVEGFPLQNDRNSLLEGAISCLTMAFSTSPSSTHVNNVLQTELSTGIVDGQCKSSVLHTLSRYSSQASNPSISLEAFQALKALAHNYPKIICLCWEEISSSVYGVLIFYQELPAKLWKSNLEQSIATMKERLMAASIKVLDESLRAISGFKGTEDLTHNNFLDDPFTSDYVKMKAISSAPSYNLESPNSQDESKIILLASERWHDVIVKHMPLIVKHTSPMIRAATITCFAGMTSSVFFSLCEDKQEFILSSSIDAAMGDDIPSVRSAACRVIGVISCFLQLHQRTNIIEKFIHAARHNARDPLVSVRIAASWALANICDTLSHYMNEQNPGREGWEICQFITLLADSALWLTRDNDKVKANAVRALGNLARFVPFSSEPFAEGELGDYMCSRQEHSGIKPSNDDLRDRSDSITSGNQELLEKMVQAFLSCVTTGNVKVQWNVCHALSNLFCNKTLILQDKDWGSSVFSILLLLLRDSSNFKTRIQAAAALSVPATVNDYGRSYYDVMKGVELIVENFKSNQISAPSNFKYWIALEKQLTSTMLHLLDLAASSDDLTIQDFLTKKALFLEEWIKGLCLSLGGTSESADDMKNIACIDTKKHIISSTIQSLVLVYERGNQHLIAQRFFILMNNHL